MIDTSYSSLVSNTALVHKRSPTVLDLELVIKEKGPAVVPDMILILNCPIILLSKVVSSGWGKDVVGEPFFCLVGT